MAAAVDKLRGEFAHRRGRWPNRIAMNRSDYSLLCRDVAALMHRYGPSDGYPTNYLGMRVDIDADAATPAVSWVEAP